MPLLPQHAGVCLVVARAAGGVEPYTEHIFDGLELDRLARPSLGSGNRTGTVAALLATGRDEGEHEAIPARLGARPPSQSRSQPSAANGSAGAPPLT